MLPFSGTGACQIRMGANGPLSSNCKSNDSRALHQAAQEFEALMIGQLLKSMKPADSSGGDSASSSMMDFAQDSLARLISQRGGIGLAHFLETALDKGAAAAATSASPASPASSIESSSSVQESPAVPPASGSPVGSVSSAPAIPDGAAGSKMYAAGDS